MIAVVDYGVGNLFSLQGALTSLGIEHCVTDQPAVVEKADRIIFPGVGAFGDAKKKLVEKGLDQTLIEMANKGIPILGICVGMQLLFEESEEFGTQKGLGLISGKVTSLKERFLSSDQPLKVPHMGWNQLVFQKDCPLLQGIPDQDFFYYVHSFYAETTEPVVTAYSEYGVKIPGVVQKGNLFGTQFHPEKSGRAGSKLLQNFVEGSL